MTQASTGTASKRRPGRRLLTVLAGLGAAGAIIATSSSAAVAATAPHYAANDTTGHRYGLAITGNAQQAIATLTARYQRDPAELVDVAAFADYTLPGGVQFLIKHPAQWHNAATGFGTFLRNHVREEVNWKSAYRTEYAIPHGNKPTTFGWTHIGTLTRDVLVFDRFALVMNCGGQPYVADHPIPRPSKPVACKTAKGKPSCSPCAAGTRLFQVPGAGAMCLCPQTVHVIISSTRTVTVQVITTVTNTSSQTTTVTYGVCAPEKPCAKQ
jgi:hypothetical protein